MPRDDFTNRTKEGLATRAGYRCAICRCATRGPDATDDGSVSIGVAAHIAAASRGGPRYDEAMSREDRRAMANGIWLCQNCAKLIDSDEDGYSVERLVEIRDKAVDIAREELPGAALRNASADRYDVLVEAFGLLEAPEDWRPSFRNETRFYCVSSPQFTVHQEAEGFSPFFEKWMKFPDKDGVRYSVFVYWHGTPIHESLFISCDGARYFLPLPRMDGKGGWYLSRESVAYRIARLYRQYAPLDETLARCGIRLLAANEST